MIKRFLLYGIPKSLLFKILIGLLILLIGKNVFAAEQNVSKKIEATPNFGGGTYYATQPVAVPVPLYQNIGTRYNGKLSLIEFYLDNTDWSWNYNKTYTITLNMATEDWRNNFMGPQVIQCNCDGSQQSSSTSSYVSNTFRFVSYKTIKFNFKLGPTMGCKTKFRLYSGNTSSTAITGVSNYNLSSVVISNTTSTPTPTPVPPVPTPTPQPNNQDIINNQSQNTQDIINNQSQNTQDIIDNNTQNASDIIENNNSNTEIINNSLNSNCKNGPLPLIESLIENDNSYLNSTGEVISSSGVGISKFLVVQPNSTYHFNFPAGPTGTYYVCEYGANKQVLDKGCKSLIEVYRNDLTTGGYTQYLRVSIPKTWWLTYTLTGPVCNNWEQDGLNSINDSINNSNVDNGTGSDFFNDFQSQDNGGISGIITKPLVLINSLLSSNNSCNNLSLSISFPGQETKNVSFPSGCILWNNVPSTVINIYQIFVVGFCSYYLLKRLFKDVEDLKNPEKDNVEVIDL